MYRNMKNKILGGLMLVLVLCFTACEDEQLFGRDGNTTIRISATAKFSGAESRAVLATEYKATENNVFMLYKGTDKNATLEVMEAMTSLEGTIENVRIEGGATYTAIMIANVPKSELESQGVVVGSKLEALYSATYAVNTTYNKPTDAAAFTWSGVVCGITTANVRNGLNFELNPNVAKVKLTVNNSSSNTSSGNESTQVVSAQVCNVKNKVRYAQNALSKAGLFTKDNNSAGSPSSINYKKDEINVAPNGGTGTLYWYVPCNMLASGVRNSNIPDGATYLELTSARGADHMSVVYKIYLGVNSNNTTYENLTNFDVCPDHIYNVTINITNDGLTFDINNKYNAVSNANTSVGLVKLPSNANCYMINPNFSKTANGYPIYELPIDRINECWLDPAINDASMSLGTNDEWVMDVIWQDINAQVIKFCDKNGNNASNTYSGTGVTPAYFKIVPSAVTSSHYGNILVGVKKKNTSDYLWSWHLWVTNYNPDVATPYSIAKGLNHTSNITANSLYHENSGVTKINGNVQHWWHIYDFYWGANNKFKSKEIWSPGGLYEDCWIMDRNLGAISYNVRTGDQQSYGCYYQWGSKNPYPHATYFIKESTKYEENKHSNNLLKKLYKITGTDTTHFTFDVSSTSLRTLKEVTKKPNICYFVNDDSKFELYDSNHKFRDNYWASLKSNPNNGYSQKSIFDPCPPGWCVPMYNTFDLMTYDPRNDFGSTYRYYRYYGLNDNNNYADGTFPTVNIWRLDEGYLNYKMKDHVEAVFMRKNKEGDANKIIALYAVFPMQGAMSMEDNGISGNSRSMYWFAESSVIPGEVGKGESIGFFSVIKKDGGNVYRDYSYVNLTTSETRYQDVDRITNLTVDTYSHIWNGRATHRPKQKSRGHTIRCIQVPGGEQLKYYNK